VNAISESLNDIIGLSSNVTDLYEDALRLITFLQLLSYEEQFEFIAKLNPSQLMVMVKYFAQILFLTASGKQVLGLLHAVVHRILFEHRIGHHFNICISIFQELHIVYQRRFLHVMNVQQENNLFINIESIFGYLKSINFLHPDERLKKAVLSLKEEVLSSMFLYRHDFSSYLSTLDTNTDVFRSVVRDIYGIMGLRLGRLCRDMSLGRRVTWQDILETPYFDSDSFIMFMYGIQHGDNIFFQYILRKISKAEELSCFDHNAQLNVLQLATIKTYAAWFRFKPLVRYLLNLDFTHKVITDELVYNLEKLIPSPNRISVWQEYISAYIRFCKILVDEYGFEIIKHDDY